MREILIIFNYIYIINIFFTIVFRGFAFRFSLTYENIILSVMHLRKWSIESSMTLSNHDHQPHLSLSSSPAIRFVVIAPFIGPHHGGWRLCFSYILSFSFYPNLAECGTYESRSMVKHNSESRLRKSNFI